MIVGKLRGVRTVCDAIYNLAGGVAALCLIGILALIVAQMAARWTGGVLIGATAYAGYMMAAASFLAFAYALNHGAHIRVSIVLNAVPRKVRRWLDVWCFAIGAAVMWYFVWYGWRFVYWSWKFGDVSQGQDATPLWIPQSAMLLGAVILAIALTDHLIHVIATGKHRIRPNLSDQSFGE
jgi:TRAP-type C4-dicarboxylate transport system permease small subunit